MESPNRVSINIGIMASFSDLMSGERCPAAVTVEKNDVAVDIAAWHACGPAKVSAKDLFQSLLRTDVCDVLIGDFNFQGFSPGLTCGGLDVEDSVFELEHSMDFEVKVSSPFDPSTGAIVGRRSKRIRNSVFMREVVPGNHSGSTTFTGEGIGKRTTGLDRCIVREELWGQVKLMVASPSWYDEMIDLADHMPLLLVMDV